MKKIKLHNRDGADLWLEKTNWEINPNIYVWELNVDYKHKYCIKYCRLIYDNSYIQSIDPSGGPFLSLGDEFEGKYKIVHINSAKNIWISERNNDNQEHSE